MSRKPVLEFAINQTLLTICQMCLLASSLLQGEFTESLAGPREKQNEIK